MFRSFEPGYLKPELRAELARCPVAYVKGQNFFETFQPSTLARYYCFTVCGMTSQMLTGYTNGAGIFACVPAGAEGYQFNGPDNVITLRETLEGRR